MCCQAVSIITDSGRPVKYERGDRMGTRRFPCPQMELSNIIPICNLLIGKQKINSIPWCLTFLFLLSRAHIIDDTTALPCQWPHHAQGPKSLSLFIEHIFGLVLELLPKWQWSRRYLSRALKATPTRFCYTSHFVEYPTPLRRRVYLESNQTMKGSWCLGWKQNRDKYFCCILWLMFIRNAVFLRNDNSGCGDSCSAITQRQLS